MNRLNIYLLLIGAAIMSTLMGFPRTVAYTYPQCPTFITALATALIIIALIVTAARLTGDCDEVNKC